MEKEQTRFTCRILLTSSPRAVIRPPCDCSKKASLHARYAFPCMSASSEACTGCLSLYMYDSSQIVVEGPYGLQDTRIHAAHR